MTKRKLVSLVLAFIICLPLIPAGIIEVGADDYASGDYTYTVSGGKATITKYTGSGGDVVIPSTLGGYPTTSIGWGAFEDCSGLTSVTIPDSVTSTGDWAFSGCSGLTSITIPDSVTRIGQGAFSSCSGLTTITIPDSVTSIDEYAFIGCSGLTSVTIPDSVTNIGDCAFSGCSGLTSITIPDSVTSIGGGAFADCSGLTSITVSGGNLVYYSSGNCIIETASKTLVSGCKNSVIPSDGSVTSIGGYAFSGCSGLTSITIPDSVTSIGYSAFYGCSGLTSITIPDSVTSIDSRAFSGCVGLTSVVIPEGVTRIALNSFYGCSGLTSVDIPVSVTTVDGNAFNGCASLQTVNYGGTLTQWNAITVNTGNDPLLNAQIVFVTDFSYEINNGSATVTGYTGSGGDIVIPSTLGGYPVTSIGDMAFYECSSLTSITIPDSVTSIGYQAFFICSGLTSITIPDSVTSIGEWAFASCSSLTSITIPDSVTSIGYQAFSDCSGLTSVTIPDSVTSIGWYAFDGCSSLETVNYGGTRTQWNAINVGTYNDPLLNAQIVFVSDFSYEINNGSATVTGYTGPGGDVVIPSTLGGYPVTSIDLQAFYNCSSLTSITIPDSVTSIGKEAFYNCTGLTFITLGNSLTSIGDSAFSNCSGLTSITIPDSVTSIGNSAFYGCRGLTSITIPDGVTSIGVGAFADCSGLTSITIGNGVTSISHGAFSGCSGLKSVTIPDGVTSIGDLAFSGCSGLTSITIPDSVTSIGESAFCYCYSLTSITVSSGNTVYHSSGNCLIETASKTLIAGCKASIIPSDGSVKSIGNSAFYYCSSLTSITIPDSVTIIDGYAFYGCSSLETVNYCGTRAQWNELSIGDGNDPLLNAEKVYDYNGPLTAISVAALPTKTVYDIGESFDSTGLTLTATYSNGATETVISDYTVSGFDSSTAGTKTLTVAYEGITTTFDVTVRTLTGISVKTLPAKLVYELGESLNTSGLTLTATYSNGATETVISDYTVSGFDSSTAGTKTVTVTYEGLTTTFDVTVRALTGISVNTLPAKTGYDIGESFDPVGLTLTATYGDGTTETITSDFTVSGFDSSTAGTKTVTVTYEGLTTSFDVKVWGDTIEISTYDELVAWAASSNSTKNVTLTADITAPVNATWTAKARFDGVLDGQGHTISGLKGGQALIVVTDGAVIKNLFVKDSEFTTESNHAATFVATPSGTTFENLYSNARISSQYHSGGIAAHGFKGESEDPTNTFISCWFDGELKLSYTFGSGIMGNQESLPNVFTDCLNTGKIIAKNNIAGISASVYDGSAVITRCVNLGEVRKVDNGEDKGLAAAIVWTVTHRTDTAVGTVDLISCFNLKDKAVTKPGDIRTGATLVGAVTEVASLEDLSAFYALKDNWKLITRNGEQFPVPDYFAGPDAEEIPNPDPAFYLTYTVSDGKATVTGYTGKAKSVPIPSTLGGYPVTAIGDEAFRGNTALTSVVIPEGVTSIGTSAFRGCLSLTSVSLPESLPAIGTGAFNGCVGLTSVVIPEGVTRIGVNSFYGCSGLTSVDIPVSVTTVAGNAFNGCTSLQTVNYGGTLTQWNAITVNTGNDPLLNAELNRAFDPEFDLTCTVSDGKATITGYTVDPVDLVFPSTLGDYPVTAIGESAFAGNMSLTSVVIPEGVTSIGTSAFRGCSSLTSVSLPESLPAIGTGAFNGCVGLTSVVIPEGVTRIGVNSFYGCSGLTSVDIPVSVTTVAGNAFNGCTTLQTVNYGGYRSQWNAVNVSDGNDPLLNAQFSCVPDPVITDISVTAPSKTVYDLGEELDTAGLVLTANYSDGSTETVATGYTLTGFDSSAAGIKTVTVGYQGFAATFEITVRAITEIAVTSLPTRAVYDLGEELDTSGLVLTAIYSDGSTVTVTSGYTLAGFDSSAAGIKTVTVGYQGFAATFEVTVREAFDPNAPGIILNGATAKIGTTMRVDIDFINNPGIWGMDLRIGYDTEALTLVAVENGEIFADGCWTPGNLSKSPYVLSAENSGFDNVTASGRLVTLVFEVSENAQPGATSITASYNSGDIISSDFEDVDPGIKTGEFTVTDFYYGDLNGDGLVNKKDALLMKMYLADPDTEIDLRAADVFYDGTVNKKDSLRLSQYLAGHSVVLGV